MMDPMPPSSPPPLPIEVEPDVQPPPLPGRVVMRPNVDTALDALAIELLIHARNCVRAFGDFQLAAPLSPLGELMIKRMMYDPNLREFPWPRTRVWLARDVDVPEGHPRHGLTNLRDLLVDHSGIPAEQLHGVPWSDADPAGAYAAALREHLGWREKGHDRLDAVVLEMDDHGGLGLAEGTHGLLCAPAEPEGGARVVSLTVEMVNASRLVSVIPRRGGPCPALRSLAAARHAGSEESAQAARVRPMAGELHWFVGREVVPIG